MTAPTIRVSGRCFMRTPSRSAGSGRESGMRCSRQCQPIRGSSPSSPVRRRASGQPANPANRAASAKTKPKHAAIAALVTSARDIGLAASSGRRICADDAPNLVRWREIYAKGATRLRGAEPVVSIKGPQYPSESLGATRGNPSRGVPRRHGDCDYPTHPDDRVSRARAPWPRKETVGRPMLLRKLRENRRRLKVSRPLPMSRVCPPLKPPSNA